MKGMSKADRLAVEWLEWRYEEFSQYPVEMRGGVNGLYSFKDDMSTLGWDRSARWPEPIGVDDLDWNDDDQS